MAIKVITLYNMVKGASEAATNAANVVQTSSGTAYSSYPTHIHQYNRLVTYVHQNFGEEAETLCPLIDIQAMGKQLNPYDTLIPSWKMYLDLAVSSFNVLEAYLKSKIPAEKRDIEAVSDFLRLNLRPSLYEDPKGEKDLQNTVETLLRARRFEFYRETVRIPYSSKTFVPDYTFETLHLALELKLCTSDSKVKEIIDEINADIPAYQTRYTYIIFVIYDLGFIRDVVQFKTSFERNLNVIVEIVKK